MKRLLAAAALALAATASAQVTLRLPERGASASGQFIIYCDSPSMRMQVATFADSLKAGLLDLLGEPDKWKTPLVIQFAPPSTAKGVAEPSTVRVFEVPEGMKIQIDVALEGDLARARFPRQLVRALLIEMASRTPLPAGSPVPDPPAWLVDGVLHFVRGIHHGTDTGIFQVLLDINRPPALQRFLAENASGLDTASGKLHDACSLALVRLLTEMPDGRRRLSSFVRALPEMSGDPLKALRKHFPTLGSSDADAEKWWTLSIARLSSLDRYKGLSLAQSDQLLSEALTVTLPGKSGEPETFTIAEFQKFAKSPLRAQILARINSSLVALQPRTHPILRPVLDEDYADILSRVPGGKSRGLEKRIADAEEYRRKVVERAGAIADYLNWYEATQITTRSDAFEGYLRMAQELAAKPGSHTDPIGRYLDSVEAAMGGE